MAQATKELVQVSSLAERFPDLTPVTPADLKDDIIERILLVNHGRPGNDEPIDGEGNPLPRDQGGQSVDERIEKVWQEKFGFEYPDFPIEVRPIHLLGAPSQAKSTAIEAAAREVAQLCGMNFISKPNASYTPGKNDLVFTSISLAGHSSAMTVGGMPSKGVKQLDGEEHGYMEIIPTIDYLAVAKSGMGVALFDEIGSAMPNIKPALNEIFDAKGKSGQLDLSHVMRVGASNLGGGVDGAMTTKNPSTLGTRCDEYLQVLEYNDWRDNYARRVFNSEAGDMGIIGFLDKNEHLFNCLPSGEEHSRPPAPRGWTSIINYMIRKYATGALRSQRHYMDIIEGKTKEEEMKTVTAPHEMIVSEARGRVGAEAANALGSYLHSLWKGAQPVAEGLINNTMTPALEKIFDREYGTGMSQNGMDFSYQITRTLPSECIAAIKRDVRKGAGLDESVATYMQRFGEAVSRLQDDSHVALTIEQLRVDLIARVPEMRAVRETDVSGVNGKKVSYSQNIINTEWVLKIHKAMAKGFKEAGAADLAGVAADMISGHSTLNKTADTVTFA